MIASLRCCRARGGRARGASLIRTPPSRCPRARSSRILGSKFITTGQRMETPCWKSSVRDLRRRRPRRRSKYFAVAERLAGLADLSVLASKSVEFGRVVHKDRLALCGLRSPNGELIEQAAVVD